MKSPSDSITAAEKALAAARDALVREKTNAPAKPEKLAEKELGVALAESRRDALIATVEAERFDKTRESEDWKCAATNAVAAKPDGAR